MARNQLPRHLASPDHGDDRRRCSRFRRIVSFLLLTLTTAGLAAAAETKPCVFCEIIAGTRQPEGVVYRNDKVVAFLSIGPRNPGHLLIVPVHHADNFLELAPDDMHAMTDAARVLAAAILRTDLRAEGFTLEMSSGQAAGQSVMHAHLHLIPRYAGEPPDKSPRDRVPMSELAPVAEKIRAALSTP